MKNSDNIKATKRKKKKKKEEEEFARSLPMGQIELA